MTRTAANGQRRAGRDGFDRRLIAPMNLGSVLTPVTSLMIAVALVPIGRAFGGRNHTTVLHAHRRTAARMLADQATYDAVGRLTDELRTAG